MRSQSTLGRGNTELELAGGVPSPHCALRATEVGLPDFGHLLTWRKSDKSDFRWERFRVRGSHLLGGGKMRLSTCEVLGHDACIPTAARRGNRSRHVIW